MFVKIIYKDENEMIVNPNCYIRLIYEYIRVKTGVPDDVEIDLCDERGVLKKIYEPPTYKCGLEILEKGETYYLIQLRVDKRGFVIPIPFLSPSLMLFEYLVKKLEVNKRMKLVSKSTARQMGDKFIFGSKFTLMEEPDAIVLTEMPHKKKKKKELKPVKSKKFPGFIDKKKTDSMSTPSRETVMDSTRKPTNRLEQGSTNESHLKNISPKSLQNKDKNKKLNQTNDSRKCK